MITSMMDASMPIIEYVMAKYLSEKGSVFFKLFVDRVQQAGIIDIVTRSEFFRDR
jgi:hypothetical protein